MHYSGKQLRRFALLLIVVLSTFVLMHGPTSSLSHTSPISERGDANEQNRSAQVLSSYYELAAPDETTRLRVTEAYGNLPLQFEANNGQSDARVEFISRGSGYTMFLTSDEAVLSLLTTSKANTRRAASSQQTLRMKLVGANPEPQITPLEQLPGRVNYFVGNDPTKWREQISTYRRVKFDSVYPGIDLIYYGNQRQLEHDFIVTPGADPKTIRLKVSGSRDMRIDAVTGDLVLRVADKEVRQLKPIVYQNLDGARREVAASYSITAKSELGFEIGAYDASMPLVIDPVLVYSSLLGGSGIEGGNAIAVDTSGNAYVTGNTTSINFPTFNAVQPARNGADDVFISKINPTGSALVYSTYLGGSTGFEYGFDITVDAAGNAYVAGRTIAADFPTTANAFQATKLTGPGQDTAFVTRLDSAGALFYSTYLSGTQSSKAWGIATDGVGNAYVTGQTNLGFPVTSSAFQANGSGNAFVSKLNTNGSGATSLVYSTLLGVSAEGRAIAADSTGNVYVTGTTTSLSFPVRNAFQPSHAGGLQDAFVTKLNTNLSGDASLIYSTFLGGSAADFGGGAGNFDSGKAIAIDLAGNAYITGQTASTNFPTANAFQPANAGFTDAFLTKLNPTGSALIYSTYLGGSSFNNGDSGRGVAVNALGNAYVTGRTQSADFPSVSSIADTGGVFLTKFSPAGNALVYSTRGIVSGVAESGTGVALDSAGNAFVTGANAGDAFVAEIADPTIIGRVVDENGNPIAGAPVNLTGTPSGTTTTDVNGYFTFGLLTFANNYTVSVSVPTFTFNSQVVNNLRKNVRLDFSPLVFTIGGQVTNAGSGLSGVTIALSGGKSLTALTNASGNYSFSNLPAGRDYIVTPSHASFTFVPTSRSFLNLSANQTADFATPQWQPVVLTAQQIVELKAWTVGGRTYVYVKPQFPDAGFRVADWGQVVRSGSEFTVDASVERFTGPSIQAVVTTAQIYDLGPLAFGIYNFNFRTSGTLAKTLQFTVSTALPQPNPIDNAREFVRQQYRDFLNREADQAGEDFWTDNITKCSDPARRPPGQPEAQCTTRQRETTSAAFFLSPEFQYTGYFVYRMYQGALGRQPKLSEFTPDAQFVGAGILVNSQLSGARINQNKADFAAQFVNCTDATKPRCAEFKAIYDGLSNQAYVDKLFQTTGANPTAAERAALVNGLNAIPATETRASVLQKVVDGIFVISEGNQRFDTTYGQAFYNAESNRAFVLLEYFGYMKRDPDDAGYAFWLGKLNQFNGNFVNAEMVLAFISSPEYRARFGQP